jgi:hypothetical protein
VTKQPPQLTWVSVPKLLASPVKELFTQTVSGGSLCSTLLYSLFLLRWNSLIGGRVFTDLVGVTKNFAR